MWNLNLCVLEGDFFFFTSFIAKKTLHRIYSRNQKVMELNKKATRILTFSESSLTCIATEHH